MWKCDKPNNLFVKKTFKISIEFMTKLKGFVCKAVPLGRNPRGQCVVSSGINMYRCHRKRHE